MLDTTIIPVLLPPLKQSDLPFQFSDIKVCDLGSESDCIELIQVLLNKVKIRFPFELKEEEILQHGENLCEMVNNSIKSRGYFYDETPPPTRRTTIWIMGSYTDLKDSEKALIKRKIPTLARTRKPWCAYCNGRNYHVSKICLSN